MEGWKWRIFALIFLINQNVNVGLKQSIDTVSLNINALSKLHICLRICVCTFLLFGPPCIHTGFIFSKLKLMF